MPHFSSDINLGTLLGVGTLLIAFYTFHMQNIKRIHVIQTRVNLMWNAFRKRFDIDDLDNNGDE